MLSNYLRKRFKANDLHQSLVARKIGVNPTLVHNWIKGKATPSFENCCKLAKLIADKEHRSPEEVLGEMSDYIGDK